VGWEPYFCECGKAVCRQSAAPCSRCGRMVGPPLTKKQKRANTLLANGWIKHGHWFEPGAYTSLSDLGWSEKAVKMHSLASAWRTYLQTQSHKCQ
jgi:hypothetical protein